jgi:hypothetical protein
LGPFNSRREFENSPDTDTPGIFAGVFWIEPGGLQIG